MDNRGRNRQSNRRVPLGDATNALRHAAVDQSDHSNDRFSIDYRQYEEEGQVKQHPNSRTSRDLSVQKENKLPSAVPDDHAAEEGTFNGAICKPRPREDNRMSQYSNGSSNTSSTFPRQPKSHIGPWQLGKTLGKGSSARVRAARHAVTRQPAAVKIIPKKTAHLTQAGSLANLDGIDRSQPLSVNGVRRMPLAIEREVAILKLIEHPNIIKLYDIWENRAEIYMVLEFVEEGDLFTFINRHGPLPEDDAVFLFRQMMSAVGYCHTYNICHRDLKPENILLNREGQVKIADFGMAALQQSPQHALRTACGSPHYAAPELLKQQHYTGEKIDIWSMGVIFFACLAGQLPFDNPNMHVMLETIKKGHYRIPPHFSKAAQNLVQRILVVDPKARITMNQMWEHPLIVKYNHLDTLRSNGGQSTDMRRGLPLAPLDPGDVDPQILRQLLSMWHSFNEDDLKRRLLQAEPNDQKLFYWLLYNYREKQLEDFNPHLTHSKSDFHHMKPPNWSKRITTCQFTQPRARGPGRSISRFTVISTVAETDDGTVRSYDPYKASQFLYPTQEGQTRITVHRNGTRSSTGRQASSSVGRSYRSHASVTGPSMQRKQSNSQSGRTTGRLQSPRSSMSSIQSTHPGTPRVRANNRYRRGVDFSNVRKRSNASQEQATHPRRRATAANVSIDGRQSPSVSSPHKKSRRRPLSGAKPALKATETVPETPIWHEDLKDFTHKIAQDCDDAFNSSILTVPSLGSPDNMRETSHDPLQLAPSGVEGLTAALSFGAPRAPNATANRWDSRPLPPVPVEPRSAIMVSGEINPEPSVARQVAQCEDVASRLKLGKKGISPPSVVATLSERRIVSAPVYAQNALAARPLPAINEDTPGRMGQLDAPGKPRVISAPAKSTDLHKAVGASVTGLNAPANAASTIRLVYSPSPTRFVDLAQVPEPLKLRKKSTVRPQGTAELLPGAMKGRADMDLREQYGRQEEHQHAAAASHTTETVSMAIFRPKKASWFRKSPTENSQTAVRFADDSAEKDGPGFSARKNSCGTIGSLVALSPAKTSKKKPFTFQFWKKNRASATMTLAGRDYQESPSPEGEQEKKKASRLTVTSNSVHSWGDDSENGARKIEVHQNWLARLFRVKPATRYLCFNISRRRTRQEVAIVLREWRKYGIRDVEVDKERNIVFASVGAQNYLNMKEVSFAAEIMMVIEHGKRHHLSIVRFTQERGAASSFHKVIDTMRSVFGSRNILVTDKQKVKMMIRTLNA